jgi:hypothetical protein
MPAHAGKTCVFFEAWPAGAGHAKSAGGAVSAPLCQSPAVPVVLRRGEGLQSQSNRLGDISASVYVSLAGANRVHQTAE